MIFFIYFIISLSLLIRLKILFFKFLKIKNKSKGKIHKHLTNYYKMTDVGLMAKKV